MNVKSAPFFARKMGAKPVGQMSNPDEIGLVMWIRSARRPARPRS